MSEKFIKTYTLIGDKSYNDITSKHIAICGLGGVGGYVAEMIARLGTNNITIIDYDIISLSNFNRQIIATDNTLNKSKTECIYNRIKSINDNANINIINDKIDAIFFDKYNDKLKSTDYLFDCIDDKYAKIEIYKYCKSHNIDFISSMGTGNNIKENLIITDIEKTKNCPLAKVIRKLCKENNLSNIKVIYNDIQQNENILGTLPTIPSIAGIKMVQNFITDIVQLHTQ